MTLGVWVHTDDGDEDSRTKTAQQDENGVSMLRKRCLRGIGFFQCVVEYIRMEQDFHPTRRRSEMTVGARIEQVRAEFGLTQAEMADKIGLKLRTYTRYVTGETFPPADTLDVLGHMGINLHWLITGVGPMRTDHTTPPSAPISTPVDGELNARIVEAVAATYKEVGGAIGHRDLGRVAAEIYNDIAAAGLENWEEKLAALRLAVSQLRRRLLAPAEPNPNSAQGKRMA